MSDKGKVLTRDKIESIKKMYQEKKEGPKEVFFCGGAGCIASGSHELKEALIAALDKNNVKINIKETGCMGPCSRGPVFRIEPEGVIYEGAKASDMEAIVEDQILNNKVVESIVHRNFNSKTIAPTKEESEFFSSQTKIVLRNCGNIDPKNIEEYIGADGYKALSKVLFDMSSDDVVEELKSSGLRGRGGAGFPTWMKWNFTKNAQNDIKYVLCNADEGDPGAFMDRSVLEGDPHSIIEGMIIAGRTIGASIGYVYVRAEYPLAIQRLTYALNEAKERGVLGDNILGSDFSFNLEIRMGSGAFVCGEETALINSLEGKRGEPRPRPPFPAVEGLWGKPTLLNNVETFANISSIIDKGSKWFASFGTEETKGTKVFALAGKINNSGLVEVPVGTSLGELLYDIGGGIIGGKKFKAAQLGGPSGGCIPKEYLNIELDYSTLQKAGAIMGSGGLIVMDEDTCMVDIARYFLEFVQDESCGKCVPCRVGTKRMLDILNRITSGAGVEGDIEKLEELGTQIHETSLCGLGQTAANPVLSTIKHFRKEYEEHIRDKHCVAGVCPGLVRAPCQSACPASVDVPGFVSLIGEGRYEEALRLHRERNPFASICARVCFHTCEDKCRRASLDDAVSIRAVKRFMVDQEITYQLPKVLENKTNAQKKIAIIGAGPAGLSCAYFLARLGYKPSVFEASSRPGGMMVQTIPEYRLPREVIAKEIRMIENLGVDIQTEKVLGKDFTLTSLQENNYEAIFLGVGAADSTTLGVPGEDAKNVVQAVPFLQHYNIRGSVDVGQKVVIVGGGNAAIDAARTSLRLGAEAVTVIYRRTQAQMSAYAEEVEAALAEGVVLRCLISPVEIIKDKNNNVAGISCKRMKLGDYDKSGRKRPTAESDECFTVEADQVIVAIGQKLHAKGVWDDVALELNDSGYLKVDPVTGETSESGIFAGGDDTYGPSSVVEAIKAGEIAAVGIDTKLTNQNNAFWRYEVQTETSFDPDADPVMYPKEKVNFISLEKRKHNFAEVEQSWCESVAQRQSKRCLRCDYGKQIRIEENVNA